VAGLPGAGWGDLRWLVLLAVLAAGLRAWQVRHTEVTSRDSIGYIRIAWELGQGDWRRVIPAAHHHPGYPSAVLALSVPVRHYFGSDLAAAMQLSAQLVSALASVLLVVPMFYLGRELFDRRVAFWATLLFQCLPAGGRVMADGLSDSLFLLWATTGLLFAARALRTGSLPGFALVGLATGLAYLTRPEGALVGVATGLVLLGMQAVRGWRRPWGSFWKGGLTLTASALVLAVPYMALIGGVTVKLTGNNLFKTTRANERPDPGPGQAAGPPGEEAAGRRGVAQSPAPLAVWWIAEDVGPRDRYAWAAQAVAQELAKGFFYVAWLPALLGLWWFRDRFRLAPGAWVLLLVSSLLALALYRVGVVMGYVSDRHALLIILSGTYWAVAAVGVMGAWLGGRLARLRPALARAPWADGRVWSAGLLVVLTGAPLARTLETLHADRAGFRQAGYWLAEHALPGDEIVDPYCWSMYYAGRAFLDGAAELPRHRPPVCYVVLDQSKSRHLRVLGLRQAEERVRGVTPAQRFAVSRGKDNAEVCVYVVPGR
jgi:4-amino-4-deoxy-L-arabinose transferase-like glycosyltransferase